MSHRVPGNMDDPRAARDIEHFVVVERRVLRHLLCFEGFASDQVEPVLEDWQFPERNFGRWWLVLEEGGPDQVITRKIEILH